MTLLKEGSVIMAVGMGTVFLFLVIMIIAMEINEKVLRFIGKYFPEAIPEAKTTKKKTNSAKKDEEIALAIAYAVNNAKKA